MSSAAPLLPFAVVLLSGLAATKADAQGKRADDAIRRSVKAANVIKAIMNAPDQSMPRELLGRAEAVVVCPQVTNTALGFGRRRGQCVVSSRTTGRWGTPVYYNMNGISFGPQIGGEKLDIMLLLMNKGGLNGLLKDKFEMGGEAGIAAGPVGRTASASTNVTLDASILSYSRNKGAFIGAAIKGVAITPDNDLNQDFYGESAAQLLDESSITTTPRRVGTFPMRLARYSRR